MRAVVYDQYGEPEQLRLRELPEPQISAEQCFCLFFQQVPALPGMRKMRRVEPLQGVLSYDQRLRVAQSMRWTVGQILDRDHGGNLPAHRHSLGRSDEPFVERPAFVSLDVRKGQIP